MKFLEAVETGIYDSSRGNILAQTLNVVKSACLLIELIEKIKGQFSYVYRRVEEIKTQILRVTT
jgi:hypothetical protein